MTTTTIPRDFNHVITKQIEGQDAVPVPYILATASSADATVQYLALDFVRLAKKATLAAAVEALAEATRKLEAAEAAEKAVKAAADQAVKKSDDAVKEAAKHTPLIEKATAETKTAQQDQALAKKALEEQEKALPQEWIIFEQDAAPEWRRSADGRYVLKQARYDVSFEPTTRVSTVVYVKRSADGYALSGAESSRVLATFRAYESKGFVSPLVVDEYFEIRAAKQAKDKAAKQAAQAALAAAAATAAAVTGVEQPAAVAAAKPLPATPAAAAPAAAPAAPASPFDASIKDTILQ
jgi:hypothetical protein